VRQRTAFPGALTLIALAATAATTVSAQQISGTALERRTAADPAAVARELGDERVWLAWSVPGTADAARTCCFRRGWNERGCDLDGRDNGWGTSSDWPPAAALGGSSDLVVLAELDHGRPRRLRAVGSSCPIRAAGRRVVALDGVDAGKSLDLLERWALDRGIGDDVVQSALAAIGYHAAPGAAPRLERLALDKAAPVEVRKNALFWAGQTLGAGVVPIARRFLAAEREPSAREHALFVLAEAKAPEAYELLLASARHDPDAHQRSQALFWISQSDAPSAAQWIREAIREEPSSSVREQGVFALSQLDDGYGELVRLLRESPDRDVRRQALFWLAQSNDPRALSEIEKLLAE